MKTGRRMDGLSAKELTSLFCHDWRDKAAGFFFCQLPGRAIAAGALLVALFLVAWRLIGLIGGPARNSVAAFQPAREVNIGASL